MARWSQKMRDPLRPGVRRCRPALLSGLRGHSPKLGIRLLYWYNQIGSSIVSNYDEVVMDPDAGVLEWNPKVTPCFSF
jgi:hypothetical protein